MADALDKLRNEADKALADGRAVDAVCYLSEMVSRVPDDRHARIALAITLGDAGNPAGALKVLRATADRLAHQGLLLGAMVTIRHGLEHSPQDPSLVSTLKRLHVRGVRAKAGNLPTPPALKPRSESSEVTAQQLMAMVGQARLERAAEVGASFPAAGEAAIPLPMPLFSELDEESFIETVRHLTYRRVAKGAKILVEGAPGDTLLVLASGHVNIQKGGQTLAKLGPGSVLGEMALITGAPRSATAVADEEVELFELSRGEVENLAKSKPKIAEELVAYCRKRLLANLLRTSPLFKMFTEEARFMLLDKFQRGGFQPGAKIIEQGRPGTGLFIIATGEVEVSIHKGGDNVVVANLGPGEVFGEISLLNDSPTTATVTARDRVGVLFLTREAFQELLKQHPEAKSFLEGLSHDRLKASENAAQATDVQSADELIVL